MGRITLTLALVAVALALPVGFLVSRAIDSEAVSTAMRHESVASRAFDEMERALSRFLAREEARPFDDYPAAPEDANRPDAFPPFVVGYFEIGPDGRVRMPDALRTGTMTPAAAGRIVESVFERRRHLASSSVARHAGASEDPDARPFAKKDAAEPGERQALDDATGERADPRGEQEKENGSPLRGDGETGRRAASPATLPPGKTQALRTPKAVSKLGAAQRASGRDDADTSDYSIFDSLNRGYEERTLRKQKTYTRSAAPSELQQAEASLPESLEEGRAGAGLTQIASATRTGRPALATTAASDSPATGAILSSAGTVSEGDAPLALGAEPVGGFRASEQKASLSRKAEPEGPRPSATTDAAASPEAAPARELAANITPRKRAAADRRTRPPAPATEALRITLDPLLGEPADAAHLVLVRAAIVGSQGYHQGLLVDLRSLGDWLLAEVIAGSRLDGVAQLHFLAPEESSHATFGGAAPFVYEHRFGEPFDSLRVVLALPLLRGESQATTVYWLVALLALVTAVGFFAVHRMTSVVVQFAQRRSNFVAAVTHELKTPLTAIRMYSEMLRDGLVSGDEKRNEYYRTITDESERLSRLIGNVLEFSKLEQGGRPLDWTVGDLGPAVREAAETLRPHAESEGFEIETQIEAGLPPVRFDRDVVIQLVFNLADNAMKYARHATERKVTIACERTGTGVVMSVRDFGPGVPTRRLRRIFEPFYRGEDELTRNTKGTGIGLALVKQLAEAMNGRVWGRNADGGGFQVCIALTSPDPAQI